MSEPSVAQQFRFKRKKRKSNKVDDDVEAEAEDSATIHSDTSDSRDTTSCFDYSVDNFFKAMDTIAQLCGEEVDSYVDPTEIQTLSSSFTFLREWKHFHYEPRSIRFACGFGSPEAKDAINCIKLPQFSSAAIPEEGSLKDSKSHESRDYLLYVGGPVWALDWCPQSDLKPDSSVKCEFLGVAAHPPGASYHKMGSPLTGRGLVQIWCVLNSSKSNEEALPLSGKSKKAHKNKGATEDNSTQIKRPRGRPRKKQIEVAVADINSETHSALTVVTDGDLENVKEVCPPSENSEQDPAKNGIMSDNITQVKKPRGRPKKKSKKNSNEVAVSALNSENQHMEALAIEFPENSAASRFADGISYNCEEYGSQTDSDAINKCSNKSVSACTPISRSNCRDDSFNHDESPLLLTQHEDDANHQPTCTSEVQLGGATCSVPEFFALPRIVLCLAHNGKVAWDLKWRPSDGSDSICKHRMGYLAFLLGNGSLEVWEVPSHVALRAIYKHGEATDPRFIKLEPVFKCSMLKRGGLQSIPLTVEWSVSPPHDYLLAGCHDGTVALWKFSRSTSLKCVDARPLLCFAGDTVPIRAVAWAPFEGDPETSNIILTAGHEGLKFWDLRDPFYPLRKLNSVAEAQFCSKDHL